MVYVFTGIESLPDDFLDTCSGFLPQWRLNRMVGYRYNSDRKLSAVAYLMLVYALKKEGLFHALPEFGYHANEKPFLTNYPNVYFNLSHCSDAVVCCLSDVEVGVDAEPVGEYDDELIRAVCNDDEYRQLSGYSDLNERARHFTELWTQKESVLKWSGIGLSGDPREILSGYSPNNPDSDFQITSTCYPAENFYISVCKKISKNL